MNNTAVHTPQELSISARLLYEEAAKRSISTTVLTEHLLKMEKDGKQWYTCGSRTSFQSSIGKTIADFKHISKKILHSHNIPTARAVTVTDRKNLDALTQLRFPLVMKPSLGNQGKDVVVGITSLEQAQQEITRFVEVSPELPVLFEEQLVGNEYRILCIDYTFVAASYREPAHVVGDGEHTIAQLIAEKNTHKWRGEGHSSPLSKIVVDELVTHNLSELQYTVDSVPKKNTVVYLRKTANLSTGGEAWDIAHEVSEENRRLFEEIARVCDLNTIGIDVKCNSLMTSLREQSQAGVLEINASPGLRMHHYPLKGSAVNIAGLILDMVETKL